MIIYSFLFFYAASMSLLIDSIAWIIPPWLAMICISYSCTNLQNTMSKLTTQLHSRQVMHVNSKYVCVKFKIYNTKRNSIVYFTIYNVLQYLRELWEFSYIKVSFSNNNSN